MSCERNIRPEHQIWKYKNIMPSSKRKLHDGNHPVSTSSQYAVLITALNKLLISHPQFSSFLVTLLCKLSACSAVDLSQVPDPSLRKLVIEFIKALIPFGIKETPPGSSSFEWHNGKASRSPMFIKVVNRVLDDEGFTLGAIREYELVKSTNEKRNNAVSDAVNSERSKKAGIFGACVKLLACAGNLDALTELCGELDGVLESIGEGMTVDVDGLEDLGVKNGLREVFARCGLVEVLGTDDDGFALPGALGANNKKASSLEMLRIVRTTLGLGSNRGGDGKAVGGSFVLSTFRKQLDSVGGVASIIIDVPVTVAVPEKVKRGVQGPMRGPPVGSR